MGDFQEYMYELNAGLEQMTKVYNFDKPFVSVIVPVYNAEKYIETCLNSLIKQTLKEIEIILINDGSTDNSLSIITIFAQYDNRIKIINQSNQKQGAARNRGLEIATGDYILFVDADDYIDINYIEEMYNAIVKNNADIAVSTIIRQKNSRYKKQLYYTKEQVFTTQSTIIEILQIPPYWYVCGKLFKKELLKDLSFEENVYYEDVGYLIRIIARTKSAITVPYINYYYVSNINSTMKSKQTIAKKLDKINAKINLIEFSKNENITLKSFPIYIEKFCGLSIKYYIDKVDYYFCGLKVFTKLKKYNNKKTFLIFNTACFGDVLLCNSLCQNIKLIYPKSKIIFIVDKPFYEVAKLQKDVDEVIIYDKKGEHKGIIGVVKFIKENQLENIFCALITYKNYRNYLISKLLNAKYILMNNKKDDTTKIQEQHSNLLKHLTHKKIENLPIKCILKNNNLEILDKHNLKNQKYIVISPITKKIEKDIPFDTTKGIIRELNRKGYKVVLSGVGKNAVEYSKKLEDENFINLVNKTSITELATILSNSHCLISADTGTMHFGCALNIPVIAVFYKATTISKWAPSSSLYKTKLIDKNQTSQNILIALEELV